jgi:hypothetical protein
MIARARAMFKPVRGIGTYETDRRAAGLQRADR